MSELLLLGVVGALEIVGPTQVSPGDLAVFRFQPVGIPISWTVLPPEMRDRFLEVVLPDGTRALVFGSGRNIEVTIVAAGYVEGEVRIVVHLFRNGAPAPNPPNPDPAPPPNPDPPKPPPPSPPFIVLWIEESRERTAAQAAAQNDRAIRDALNRVGWTLRIVDKDIRDERGNVPVDLAPWIDKALKEGIPRIYFIDRQGRYRSVPAPQNREQFIGILREMGLQVSQTASRPPGVPASPVYVLPYAPAPCVGGVCIR